MDSEDQRDHVEETSNRGAMEREAQEEWEAAQHERLAIIMGWVGGTARPSTRRP